jgi:Ca-activated chloride channel family protein
MSFIWPTGLFSLLLIPLLMAGYVHVQQRRRALAARYGTLGVVQESGGRRLGRWRHLPPVLLLCGLALLLLALARPQAVVRLPREEGSVILAFDVSGSMAATDLAPTRLEAAKAAARAFVAQQPRSVLIGVVSFSESGFGVQLPTSDQEMILAAIERLSPQLGTSLGNGIYTALNTLAAEEDRTPRIYSNATPAPTPSPTPVQRGTYGPAVIVLLTDGENTIDPDPLAAAQAAADRGVRIYTVGIGSPEGAILDIEGFKVHTQLDAGILEQISELTGGAYYNAETEEQLRTIYENLNPQWVVKPKKMELTSIFAGASILVLLSGAAFSLLWFGRVP